MESSVHCRHDNTACVAVPLLNVALDVAAAALAVRNGGSPLRLAQDVVHPSNGRKCASRSTTSFSVTLRAGKRFQSTAAAKLLTAFGASVCACVRASVRAFTCARLEQPIVMRPEVAEWKKNVLACVSLPACQPLMHVTLTRDCCNALLLLGEVFGLVHVAIKGGTCSPKVCLG